MSKNSKSTTARHNILFNLNDEQQRIAHEYLARIERKQAKTIAQLICSMLAQNGIKDVSVLSKETLEELALSPATKTQQVNVQNMEEMATMFEKAFASAIKFASASTLSKEGIVTGEPKTVGNTVLIPIEEIGIEDSKEKDILYKKEEDLDEDDFDETESEEDFEDDFDEGDSDINSELFKSFL
jgi:L-lactate utilization protein LutC